MKSVLLRLVPVALILAISAPSPAQTAPPHPNIVFFLVDDLGWSDTACYGSDFYETPHIDRLADEGVRFTQAYAACHVCSPTRASILTGKYPARLHLTDWLPGRKDFSFQKLRSAKITLRLPLEEVTLAEALKKHGYATGHFGKWHLGEFPAGPLQQGFDVMIPRNWYRGWPKSGYLSPFHLDGISDSKNAYLTDRLTDAALRFIEKNKEQPFFLYLSHFAVHDPIQGRPDLVEKYRKKLAKRASPKGPAFILEGNPDDLTPMTREQLNQLIEKPSYAGFQVLPKRTVKIKQIQDNVEFAAMVESMDQSLGRVMEKLNSLGLEENTLIVFTSDNGGMSGANFGNPRRIIDRNQLDDAFSTSNLPLRGAKGWLYEGGIRIPTIVKWPGHGKAGSVCGEPIISTDFYPSILDMAGLPALPEQTMDGVSFVPALKGEPFERGAIYWHFPHYSNHGMQSPGGAVRMGDFKLLEYFENGTVQLFNLKDDPGEQNDLARKQPEMVAELRKKLGNWRKKVSANLMSSKPDTPPESQSPTTPSGNGSVPTVTFQKLREMNVRILDSGASLNLLVRTLGSTEDPGVQTMLLSGMLKGLEGRGKVTMPIGWKETSLHLYQNGDSRIRQMTRVLDQIFGDAAATKKAFAILRDTAAPVDERSEALKSLVTQNQAGLRRVLKPLLNDPALQIEAIRAYSSFEDPHAPDLLLSHYPKLGAQAKRAVIETLATRASYANALLTALKNNDIPRKDVPAYIARSLSSLLGKEFTEFYGDIGEISKDKAELIARYKAILTPKALSKADASRGRAVFQTACAVCHHLYGEGGEIGPDLTGSNRADLDYILFNMIDPSADVPDAYKLLTLKLKDGRILAGILSEEDDQRIVLNTIGQKLTVLKTDLFGRELAPVSMMPEGLLPSLRDSQVLDLVKYLQTTKKVALPK